MFENQSSHLQTSSARHLHVFSTFATGGAQRRFAAIAEQLDGPDYTIAAMDNNFEASVILSRNIKYKNKNIDIKPSMILSAKNLQNLTQLYRHIRPTLICTYNWGALEAVIANRRLGLFAPHFPHIHFEDGFGAEESASHQIWRRCMARKLFLRNIPVIVPSLSLYRVAQKFWGLQAPFLQYIPNGVDITHFAPRKAPAPQDMVIIGTVGALRPEKNYARLLDIFAHSKTSRARLHIAGQGQEMQPLLHRAQSLNISDYVEFSGYCADPLAVYHGMDIFALTSDTEQMPLTVLEAMACGLPILATEVGDIRHMVADENRPFILPKNDTSSLANALTQLIESPDLRARLGAANRHKAEKTFSHQDMIDKYAQLFEHVGRRQ
ncbi:MAG: glycosyltransferase family 4 protein [bacterium]